MCTVSNKELVMRNKTCLAVIALFCVTATLLTACDILGGDLDAWRKKAADANKIPGTESNPYPLVENIWANGSFTSINRDGIWYSFNVYYGTTYYIWWNDRYQGDYTKTAGIYVRAQYSNGTYIFNGIQAWNYPQQFTANTSGTVKISVGEEHYNTGTFAIVYSTGSTRPQ